MKSRKSIVGDRFETNHRQVQGQEAKHRVARTVVRNEELEAVVLETRPNVQEMKT